MTNIIKTWRRSSLSILCSSTRSGVVEFRSQVDLFSLPKFRSRYLHFALVLESSQSPLSLMDIFCRVVEAKKEVFISIMSALNSSQRNLKSLFQFLITLFLHLLQSAEELWLNSRVLTSSSLDCYSFWIKQMQEGVEEEVVEGVVEEDVKETVLVNKQY